MELRRALIALLLYESEGRPKEGLFHWFVLHNGVTLATWALAIFAWIPLLSLLYVIRSKKRDDQFRLLQWLDSQFNSAAMISTRRETGKKMLENDVFRDLHRSVPPPGWPIISFFDRIAALWSDGRLDIGDIDIAYREYIFQIWQDFGKHLSGDLQQGRCKQLETIRDELQALDERRH